jgi:large subunit ribosomal protein L33
MAKPSSLLVKLVSTADTGYYYVTKKNPRTQTDKLTMRKYDPVVRKHVEFKEGKIKSGCAFTCELQMPPIRAAFLF